MATRRLTVTLCIVVQDLDYDTRTDLARDLLLDDIEEPEELPTLADYSDPAELGHLLADFIDPETVSEVFGGSDIYVTFGSAQLLNASWLDEVDLQREG